jgi:RNA polymerase sigma factor (sigma-70 family)
LRDTPKAANGPVVVSLAAKALEGGYEREFPRLYGYVRYRVEDRATADDLTSQAFLRALDRLSTFDPARGAIGPWLLGIARNLVRDHLRSRRRWRWLPLTALRDDPAPEPTPEQGAIDAESRRVLLSTLRHLSDRERDVLGLKFAGGLSHREIAVLTGLGESHVAVILYRALGRLRRELCGATAGAASTKEARRA